MVLTFALSVSSVFAFQPLSTTPSDAGFQSAGAYMFSKDGSNTFDRATDSLEAIRDAIDLIPWFKSGSDIYFSTGSVGIGTTAPSSQLTVVSSQTTTPTLELNGIADQTADFFQIKNSADSQLFTVDSSGNVGIGTSSPGAKLEVAVSDSTEGLIVNSNSEYKLGIFGRNSFETTYDNGTLAFGVDSNIYSGRIILNSRYIEVGASNYFESNTYSKGLYDESLFVQDGIWIGSGNARGLHIIGDTANGAKIIAGSQVDDDLEIGHNDMQKNIIFSTSPVSDSTRVERMRISSNGNIGIGTTSPSSALDTGIGSVTTHSLNLYTGSNGIRWTGGNSRITYASNKLELYNYNSEPIVFTTNQSERMRVDGSGNVGIGTTSPGALLSLDGADTGTSKYMLVTPYGESTNFPVLDLQGVSSGDARLGINIAADTTAPGQSSQTVLISGGNNSANPTSVRITSRGRFGIEVADRKTFGSSNYGITRESDSTMQIHSQANDIRFSVADGDTGGQNVLYINGVNDAYQGFVGIGNSAPLSKLGVTGNLSVGATYGAIAAPVSGAIIEGNVGIGTTDPQGLLDVRGSLCLNGGADCRTTWPTSGDLGSIDGSGTAGYLPKFSDADTLADSAIFESAGNVGIGTTEPGEKLDVSGRIMSSSLGQGAARLWTRTDVDSLTLSYNSKLDPNDSGSWVKDVSSQGSWTWGWMGSGTIDNDYMGFFYSAGDAGMPGNALAYLYASGGFALGSSYSFTDPGAGNMIIEGNVGIGTTSPGTLLEMSSVSPDLTLWNNTAEDTDDGRESRIIFEGSQSGGEHTTLGLLEFSHDGTADDQAGRFTIKLNDGDDGDSPTTIFRTDENFGIAMGAGAVASGGSSVAIGNNTTASEFASVAIGNLAAASGASSVSMGYFTSASGAGSTAMGDSTTASGSTSTAMGGLATASGAYSTAMGMQTTASGYFSTATGYGTTAQAYGSFVLGKHNIISGTTNSWVDTEPLFVIGNGSSAGARANALTVLKNGNIGIGTTDPQGLLDVRGSLCLNGGADCRTTWPTSGDLGSVDGSGTANYLPKFSDADTLANSAIFESAGNVGIGTTSPGAKLHTFGTESLVTISESSVANNWNRIVSTAGTVSYGINNGNYYYQLLSGITGLNFMDSGGHSFLYGNSATGNVGIGTTSPSDKLTLSEGYLNIHTDGNSPGAIGIWFDETGATPTARSGAGRYGIAIDHYAANNQLEFTGVANAVETNVMTVQRGGNIGIGTTSPGAKLDVFDNTDYSTATDFRTANNLLNLIASNDTDGNIASVRLATGGTGGDAILLQNIYNANNNQDFRIAFQDSGVATVTEHFRILNNGNIGIGTTSPGAKLQVVGTSNQIAAITGTEQPYLTIGTASNTGGFVRWNTTSNTTQLGNHNIAGGGGVLVDNNGNVGIGTTSPGALLHINGASSGTQTYGQFSTGPNAGDQNLKILSGASRDHMALQVVTGGGTNDDLSLNPNGGNVGIGKTGPLQKLDVDGKMRITNAIIGAHATAFDIYTDTADASDTKYLRIGGGGDVAGTRGAFATFYGNESASNPADIFLTPGTSGDVIINNGNIGIGTTEPGNKLQVYANNAGATSNLLSLWNNNNTDNSGAALVFNFNGGLGNSESFAKIAGIRTNNPSAGSTDLQFFTGAGGSTSEQVRITSTGNIGIGTTSPGYPLQIGDSENRTTPSLVVGDYGTIKITPYAVGHNYASIFTGSGESFRLSAGSDSNHLVIDSTSGNVGIGTTAPSNKLSINGGKLRITNTDGTGDNSIIFDTPAVKAWAIGSDDDDGEKLKIGASTIVGNSNVMTLQSDGNVGIGTTSPKNKLDIEGGLAVGATYSGTVTAPTNGAIIEGNLGIGTTAPGASFHVNHTTADQVSIFESGDNTANLEIKDNTDSVYLGVRGAQEIAWFGASNLPGTDSINLNTTNGNIGIGTTAPISTVHIESLSPYLTISNSSTAIINGNILGLLNFYSQDSSSNSKGGMGNIRVIAANNFDSGSVSSDMAFYTHSLGANDGTVLGAATEKMRILANGNVGIGTTAPDTKLHIVDSTSVTTFTGDNSQGLRIENGLVANEYALLGFAGYPGFAGKNSGQIGVKNTPTGSFMQFGTSNSYAVGVNNIAMTIDPTGNIGIGTTSPGAKLDVVGKVRNTTGVHFLGLEGGGAGWKLEQGTNSLALKRLTGTSQVSFDDNGSYFNNGNVGIGTTSPGIGSDVVGGTVLTIFGTGASDRGLLELAGNHTADDTTMGVLSFINSNNINDGPNTRRIISYMRAVTETTDANAGGDSGGHLQFYTKPEAGAIAERMRIQSDGNVGIGTTNPSRKFEVFGDTSSYNVSIGGANRQILIGTEIGNVPSIQGYKKEDSTYQNLVLNPNGGNIGIGTTSPGAKLDISASNNTTLRVTNSTTADYLTLQQTDSGSYIGGKDNDGNIDFAIRAYGDSYFNAGNLGIGTTDPQGLLDVRGSLCLNGGADCRTTWPTSGDLGSVDGSGTANYLPKFSDSDTLADSAIFDDGAGNVGIGTTSPGAKLEVNGLISADDGSHGLVRLSPSVGVNTGYIEFLNSSDTRLGYIGGGSSTNLNLNIENGASFNINGGNIGIGTTEPTENLHIVASPSDGSVKSSLILQGASGQTMTINSVSNDAIGSVESSYGLKLRAGQSQPMYFYTGTGSGTEKVRITTDGNIGIGTTSPISKLHVVGNSVTFQQDSGSGMYVTFNHAGTAKTYIGSAGSLVTGGNVDQLGLRATDEILFSPGGSIEKMRITSTGNVGIGTTSPGSKLHLDGGNIKVSSSGSTIDSYAMFEESDGGDRGYCWI